MTSDDAPLVTVAVSTRNRPAGLAALFVALEGQTLPLHRFEVVVVDDASTDDTPRFLKEAKATSPLRLSVLRLDTNRGQAVGRNLAWRRSQAGVVAFTDDDCRPAPQWLDEGLRAMSSTPAVVVGATQPDPAQLHLMNPLARTMRVGDARVAPTCNIFYLRDDLEAVDGFDEDFGPTAGEDTDLAWRVHGFRNREVRFCPSALVHHDVRRRSAVQAIRESRRWVGMAKVVARHPKLSRQTWGYFFRPSHPRALVATAGAVTGGFFFPPAWILVVPWLRHRIFRGRPGRAWIRNLAYIPALYLLDLAEVAVLARGSLRNRTLIL